jgi:hypothetical protein
MYVANNNGYIKSNYNSLNVMFDGERVECLVFPDFLKDCAGKALIRTNICCQDLAEFSRKSSGFSGMDIYQGP